MVTVSHEKIVSGSDKSAGALGLPATWTGSGSISALFSAPSAHMIVPPVRLAELLGLCMAGSFEIELTALDSFRLIYSGDSEIDWSGPATSSVRSVCGISPLYISIGFPENESLEEDIPFKDMPETSAASYEGSIWALKVSDVLSAEAGQELEQIRAQERPEWVKNLRRTTGD